MQSLIANLLAFTYSYSTQLIVVGGIAWIAFLMLKYGREDQSVSRVNKVLPEQNASVSHKHTTTHTALLSLGGALLALGITGIFTPHIASLISDTGKNAQLQSLKRKPVVRKQPSVQTYRDKFEKLTLYAEIQLKKNSPDRALQYFNEALEITKTGVLKYPLNWDLQTSLATTLHNIADMSITAGDTQNAINNYELALEIRKTIAEIYPAKRERQRDLSISYDVTANALVKQGNTLKALEYYNKSLEIILNPPYANPENTRWQKDLVISYGAIADIYTLTGNAHKALEFYNKSLDLVYALNHNNLEHNDQTYIQWQSYISLALIKKSYALMQIGNGPKYLQINQQGFDAAQKLATENPANNDLQKNLAMAWIMQADIIPQDATNSYKNALEIAQNLHKSGRLSPGSSSLPGDIQKLLDAARAK